MTAAKKREARGIASFMPGADDADDRFKWQEGQRRKLEERPSYRLLWPNTDKERRDLFEAWHGIAMQIVADARGSYRTLAVLWRFIYWKSGSFFPTDETLAACAGQCSEKTISRDIRQYEALGILEIELGWRRDRSGKWKRSRFMFPTIPRDMKATITLPVVENHTDTSGPYEFDEEDEIHTDTSGPDHTDTSGPFTLEEPLKRSGGDEAA